MFSFIAKDSGFVTVVNRRSYAVNKSHPRYKDLLDAVKNEDAVTFEKYINQERAIQSSFDESCLSGKVEIKDGQVLYEGQPVHNTLSTRILEFQHEGIPFEPLVKFMENLYQNPSMASVKETYDFLENKNLPITEDGCFLAYKAVQSDYFSKTAGDTTLIKGMVRDRRVYNGIGEDIECPRNQVDDNRGNDCSYGLHVGGLEYVLGFGGNDDKTVIVKVNPKDVVSVPTADTAQKCRVCAYKVISEYSGPMPSTCVNEENPTQPVYCCDEDDYDDDDFEDDWNDECENCDSVFCDGNCDEDYYLENFDDVCIGDCLDFVYNDENRLIEVTDKDATHIWGNVLNGDPSYVENESNVRCFLQEKMEYVEYYEE